MSDYIKDAKAHSVLLSTELYKTLEKADWSKRHKIFSNIYEYGHSGELFVKAFGEEIILTLQLMSQNQYPIITFGPEVRTLDGLVQQAIIMQKFDSNLFTKPENQQASS